MSPAPKGHPMWAKNFFKPKKYTPEELFQNAMEYFQWCDDNPWMKNEAIKSGDLAGQIMQVPTQRPYTIQGLCVYLSMSHQTFLNYESAEGYENYFEVTRHIREIIQMNQLEGASVGSYNSNIISKLLGLTDKMDITSGGKEIKNVISFGGKEVEV